MARPSRHNKNQGVALARGIEPVCMSNNAAVQEVWDSLAPVLIKAGVVHPLNAHIFTQYCNLLVLTQAQAHALTLGPDVEGGESMFHEMLAYDEAGHTYRTKVESGASKAYRQYLNQLDKFAKFFSLRPKDMQGFYNMEEEDEF